MAKKLFCPKCGSHLSEGDLFCVECGNKIEIRKSQESVDSTADIEMKQEQKFNVHMQGEQEERVILREDAALIDNVWNPSGALRLTNTNLSFRDLKGKTKYDTNILLTDVENVKIIRQFKLFGEQHIAVFLKDKKVVFSVEARTGWFDKINEAVSAAKKGGIPVGRNSKVDYIDELHRLKELMDDGIITREEFEAKKKSLLGL